MNSTKVTPQLEARLAAADEADELDIIVELQPSPSPDAPANRAQRIAAMKEAFRQQAQPVAEAIEQAGGQVTGQAWLNQTVRARVPARVVKELSTLERVASFDVPHQLESD